MLICVACKCSFTVDQIEGSASHPSAADRKVNGSLAKVNVTLGQLSYHTILGRIALLKQSQHVSDRRDNSLLIMKLRLTNIVTNSYWNVHHSEQLS